MPALFMQDADEQTCVLAHEKLTADSCKAVDFNRVALISLKKNDGTEDSVRVTPSSQIYKFSLDTHL